MSLIATLRPAPSAASVTVEPTHDRHRWSAAPTAPPQRAAVSLPPGGPAASAAARNQPGERRQLVHLHVRHRHVLDAPMAPADQIEPLPRLVPERRIGGIGRG